MSPATSWLLVFAAVFGTVLGIIGLIVAIAAIFRKRRHDRDFAMVARSNDVLIRRTLELRANLDAAARMNDALAAVAAARNDPAEALLRIHDLETELAAVTAERDHWYGLYHGDLADCAIFDDEIDAESLEDTNVVTSAQRLPN